MLKLPLPSRPRWYAGLVVVAALTAVGGWSAWAAQPPRAAASAAVAPGDMMVTMKVSLDGQPQPVAIRGMAAGESDTFQYASAGHEWTVLLTIKPLDDGTLFASADIRRDGESQAEPQLIFKPGPQGASIRMGQDESPEAFKGIEIELMVALPATESVSMSDQETTARAAAIRVAAKAGLHLANPEVLDAHKAMSFRLNDIPASIALQLIAEEVGRDVRIDGDQVHFE